MSENVDRLIERAIQLQQNNQHTQAAALYKSIVLKQPDLAHVWVNLGTALRNLGHSEAALTCLQKALTLRPHDPSFLTNLGNVLTDLDRMNEALRAHEEASQLRPNDFIIRKNYATSLREFGQFELARLHFAAAYALRPDQKSLKYDLASVELAMGLFDEGWVNFEHRWDLEDTKRRAFKQPAWAGQDLKGKTILIYGEQGFGDAILCSRYLPLVKARGGRVLLECKKPLHKLFSTIPGHDVIGEYGEIKEKFDYQIPIMSLPGLFNTNLKSIPPIPPLYSADNLPAPIGALFAAAGDKLKVGIVWSGSTTFKNNKRRAVSVERFLPLAKIPGVQLYSLQKGPCEKELYEAGADALIWDLSSALSDFSDTAAIIKKLDLVIMTDSSVAHLAGSLNCPIWNLLNFKPYWLYLRHRNDSPWYPSMRLFRQSEPGAWDEVFAKVAHALEKEIWIKSDRNRFSSKDKAA